MKQHLLGILLAVVACFGAYHPTLAQNTNDIVDRLNTSLGVSLPSQYQTTVKNFLATHAKMQKKIRPRFTEQFIKDQMKTNWGINKQNQLLFIWDAVYEQITGKQLYTGEDGNQTRLNEFEKAIEKAEACGKKYNKEFDAYLDQVIADADRRSAEADRRSAEATRKGLNEMIRFYTLYKRNPSNIKPEEIKAAKGHAKWIIPNCKKYNIDYKSKLSPEIRKFYGIE
jgi:hypothetical protein